MLCKIAERPQNAKSVSWNQVRPTSGKPGQILPLSQAPPAEVGELKARIAELERSRQAEIAQTRQAALQEGIRQGREESAAEVKSSADRLAHVLADLVSLKRNIRSDAELELLQLSLAIARRILYRELLTDPEALHGLVHAALQKIQSHEIWRVRVYPAGSEALRSSLERVGLGSLEIIADPALKTGDLLFETVAGQLDASVDTQLQEIQRGFADRLALR